MANLSRRRTAFRRVLQSFGLLVSSTLTVLGQEPSPPVEKPAVEAKPADAKPVEPKPAEANVGFAQLAEREPAVLQTVVEKLSLDNRKLFAEMLAKDWNDRPEWADMLISLLKKEQMRPGLGWFKPSDVKYTWRWLAVTFDANKDGVISEDELPKGLANAEFFLARLDRDYDGEVRADDFSFSGRQQSTPPMMMTRMLTGMLDSDSNGHISPEELQQWLKRADKDQTGFLTSEDLFAQFSRMFNSMNRPETGDTGPSPDEMLGMFFRGETGLWEEGPKVGDVAPEFSLPTHDGSRRVTLSESRGKPVILIFGSFT